ncbi:hypothetical protein F5Y07DRAFT_349717, partial [Xylaria sp. FL0933]
MELPGIVKLVLTWLCFVVDLGFGVRAVCLSTSIYIPILKEEGGKQRCSACTYTTYLISYMRRREIQRGCWKLCPLLQLGSSFLFGRSYAFSCVNSLPSSQSFPFFACRLLCRYLSSVPSDL